MTDPDAADDFVGRLLFEAVGRPRRAAAVRACLAGNDTQCFTTQLYRDAYDRIGRAEAATRFKCAYVPPDWTAGGGLAEMHLRTSGLVVETSPGVWIPCPSTSSTPNSSPRSRTGSGRSG